jgi:hypothetical protein
LVLTIQLRIAAKDSGLLERYAPFARLNGLAPLRDAVRPPYRPYPARGRGRPRLDQPDVPADSLVPTLSSAPLTPIDRRQFDYSDLDHWMAHVDQAIRQTRRTLQALPGTMLESLARDRQCGSDTPAADLP